MDKRRTQARPRLECAVGPCLEALEARRLLSAQVRIQEVNVKGVTELLVTGTNRADVINITDNGTGTAGNVTVTQPDGSSYTSTGAIGLIEVLGKGGNDQVTYTLSGNLVAPQNLMIDLGSGDDQFTANINGAIDNPNGLGLQVYGDGGNNQLTVNQTGPVVEGNFAPMLKGGNGQNTLTYNGTGAIGAGTVVSPGLSAGGGNTTIDATYSGLIDGTYIYNLAADAQAGRTNINENVNVAPGSTGSVGSSASVPAVVRTGNGSAQVTFAVRVPTGTPAKVYAYVSAGRGRDVIQHTANVNVNSTNRHDTVSVIS